MTLSNKNISIGWSLPNRVSYGKTKKIKKSLFEKWSLLLIGIKNLFLENTAKKIIFSQKEKN
ncbi:MAG: hypothetical protein JHC26_03105 [Thermofilum sp.]|jgi:hypothetical protein|uniref:hypothetical protein n=1 Tax=Thermofilum sp. TaxID=1961369 RepID=UPI00258F5E4A|nr:hypothetical protein [Thermofilum sp.]MCI4408056.1 hypothetical protein [Thermofilum sp.]